MRTSGSRIEPALMAATVIHFFFADFFSTLTSTLFAENNWKTASSALRLVVAAGSADLPSPSSLATLGKAGAAGISSVVWRDSGVCEARLGDPSTNSLVNSGCLTTTGADAAVTEARGLSPVVDTPRASVTAASAPVVVKQPELTNELVDGSPSRASQTPESRHTTLEIPAAPALPSVASEEGLGKSAEPAATTRRKADEAVFQLFSANKVEVKVEKKSAKKKWITVAAISAGSILLPLVLMIPLFHHGTKSEAKHSVQPLPGASDPQPMTDAPNPSASKPPAQGKPLATTGKQQATDNQPTSEEEGTTSPQVQTTMMNDQLTAPTRIPKQNAENAPPPASLDTASTDGLGGGNANASMFNGHSQPNVKVAPSKPVAISSGVATGMLIQKTPPEYPPIAKTAHVAGTVELHAIISTDGTIKDLHALSGPVMLRQAALDAVRNWRYKPYRLNNQPVEVETTINVVFTLGG